MELILVFKEINRLRNGIEVTSGKSGNLRARSHPAKFPIYEKQLKKRLKLDVVVHGFNPSTGMAETGGSLSLRPA